MKKPTKPSSSIPATRSARIHKRLTELGLKLKQILVTHAHIDHVGGALKLKRLTGAPIFLNENDLPQLNMMDDAGRVARRPNLRKPRRPTQASLMGSVVGLDSLPAQVMHTPGHTQGSVCLHFAPLKLLVAGDTLFAGSIGRTDLPGGDFDQIIARSTQRVLALARRNAGPSRPRTRHHNR